MGFISVFLVVVAVSSAAVLFITSYPELMHWHSEAKVLLGSSHLDRLSDTDLGIIRSVMALMIWAVNYRMISDSKGINLTIVVPNQGTKLITLTGPLRFATFTVWSWTLMGVYFTLAAMYSFTSSNPESIFQKSDMLANITCILFEISFPVSFLVSYIVTYVIIPSMVRAKLNTDALYTTSALMCHNANVVFMTIEMLLNKVVVNEYHFVFIIFYALAYTLFAWVWYYFNGYFFYFFLDFNHKYAVPFHIGLLAIVAVMFTFGYLMFIFKTTHYGFSFQAITLVMYLGMKVSKDKVKIKK